MFIKKILSILLVLSLVFWFASCGETTKKKDRDSNTPTYAKAKKCSDNIKSIKMNSANYYASNDGTPIASLDELADTFDNGKIPECPLGGEYLIEIKEDGSAVVECPNCDMNSHKPNGSGKVSKRLTNKSTAAVEVIPTDRPEVSLELEEIDDQAIFNEAALSHPEVTAIIYNEEGFYTATVATDNAHYPNLRAGQYVPGSEWLVEDITADKVVFSCNGQVITVNY